MPRALDRDAHTARLLDLVTRFRAQERWMATALQELQSRLEHWHREASYHQLDSSADAAPLLRRCHDLQTDYDDLAAELAHVRMAICGAGEELMGTHAAQIAG